MGNPSAARESVLQIGVAYSFALPLAACRKAA